MTNKQNFLSLLFWIKQIYPIVFFSSFVYTAILFLNLFGVYNLQIDNPVIILGYISLIHFFSYPLFQMGINGNSFCLLIFPYINLTWIVAVVICNVVIKLFITDSPDRLKKTPLHYHFTIAYFSAAIILELLLMIFKTQEMKKIHIAVETQESEEKIITIEKPIEPKIPKEDKDFRVITILNQNPFNEDLIKELKETKENAKENAKGTFKKISLPNFVTIDKVGNNYTDYKSNKEQVTAIIETQNSIRNLLNKKS